MLRAWKQLHAAGDRVVLLAFSGGPDSLALGLALSRIAPLGDFRLVAVHVDHRLRASSAAEAANALALAGEIDLDCRLERLSRHPTVTHPGVSIEEAARRDRYAALARHADELDAAFVVTAHHQEDQAETVLLHLMRGAGLAGAAGMAPLAVRQVPWWPSTDDEPREIKLWRPWLAESRNEIAMYREKIASALRPVLDPSNADATFLRNRLRGEIMPSLEELRPGAAAAFGRYGRLAAMDDQLLNDLAVEAEQQVKRTERGIALDSLNALPESLLRRVLRLELQIGFHVSGPSSERLEALLDAIRAGRGDVTIQLGEGVLALVTDGHLRLMYVEADR